MVLDGGGAMMLIAECAGGDAVSTAAASYFTAIDSAGVALARMARPSARRSCAHDASTIESSLVEVRCCVASVAVLETDATGAAAANPWSSAAAASRAASGSLSRRSATRPASLSCGWHYRVRKDCAFTMRPGRRLSRSSAASA